MAQQGIEIFSNDIKALSSKYSPSLIRELKKTFPEESDETLARFLIARNGDHVKAREMLREHIVWRKDNPPVSKETCLGEILKGKVYYHGKDKEGHPLAIYRPRLNDPATRDMEEMSKMVMWWASVIIADMPPEISKCTILIDRTDVGNPDKEFVHAFSSVFQNNYPERVSKVIVYPGGWLFVLLWNAIKWFLDPVTQAKVKPVMYLEGVQEFIDDEFIPRSMGGECDYDFDQSGADLPSDPVLNAAAAVAGNDSNGGEKEGAPATVFTTAT
jgi:hypothetical protein